MKIKEIWKNTIGIYCIKNLVNNKCYIGSSINIQKRLLNHKTLLKHNKHNNPYLQNAWSKYGEDNFACYILEKCDVENLLIKEQYWVDVLGNYNITKEVIRNTPSQESKEKMSATRKERISTGEILKQNTKKIKKYSICGKFIEEFESMISASRKCAISTDQIRRVLQKKHKTAGGFQWKYSNDNSEILPYYGRDYTIQTNKMKKNVLVLDTFTYIFYEFESYNEAALFFNTTQQAISNKIKTKKLYKKRYIIQDLLKLCELLENP